MRTVVKEVELSELSSEAGPAARRLGERLDLIGHVNVQLTVTLGGAQISVERLFSLTTGEVLPLDRDVDAPVDVRLGGKLIARGQLMAAGDRFAVSITELTSE